MRYYQLVRDMSKFNLRLNVVKKAKETSISEAARYYGSTRKTVRRLVRNYERYGLVGLKDRKRVPKHIPHKMKEEDELSIVELRKRHPSWGARRLKERYKVKGSYSAIHRVIKQNNFIKPKKKRWRKRKDRQNSRKGWSFLRIAK